MTLPTTLRDSARMLRMKPASRWFLAVCVLGSAITALTTTAALRVRAHGSEARYVREVDWNRPRIAHTYGLSYSELGLGAYRNEVETRTVGGRQCVAGGLIGFDVDDGYAFDVDEPVTLTLTYAPALTAPFTVVWDRNGGDGLGRAGVRPEAGEALQSVTLTLDRARLAGHGTRGIDIAVGSRDGLCVCDVEVTRSGATEAPTASGRVRLQITDASSGRPCPPASVSTTRPAGCPCRRTTRSWCTATPTRSGDSRLPAARSGRRRTGRRST